MLLFLLWDRSDSLLNNSENIPDWLSFSFRLSLSPTLSSLLFSRGVEIPLTLFPSSYTHLGHGASGPQIGKECLVRTRRCAGEEGGKGLFSQVKASGSRISSPSPSCPSPAGCTAHILPYTPTWGRDRSVGRSVAQERTGLRSR